MTSDESVAQSDYVIRSSLHRKSTIAPQQTTRLLSSVVLPFARPIQLHTFDVLRSALERL